MAPRTLSRRRREQDDEPHSESIFDILDPNGTTHPPKAKTQAESEAPTMEELMAKLAAQQDQLDRMATERSMADSRVQPQAQTTMPERPTLNLESLPDPVTDAKAYAQAIAERTMAYQSAIQDYTTKASAATAKPSLGDPDALWEDFTEQYPDYADAESQIRFATAEVAQRLAKRGVDVQKYMFTHADQFYKSIVKEFDKTFGSPVEDPDEGDERATQERQATRRRARTQDDGDDDGDGRTDGILGGSENQGVRQGAPKPKGGLIEDLQAIQRKTGYY